MHATILLVLVFIPAYILGDESRLSLPLKCLREYKKVVSLIGGEDEHCLRLQLIANCFSERPDDSDAVLDDMRYLFTQELLFVKKLAICPDVDLAELKKITDKTDVAQKHKYLDSVDEDHWEECAATVHKTCIKKYLSLLRDGKLCNDVDAWIDCYDEEAKRASCSAVILDHFQKMLKVVGKSVVKSIRRFMGAECSKTEL
ncbi:uncharacterized protein LOC110249624 isoform X2 [Exaiptasia diaphana]|uniref:Uncharacterized protein n=1 Tax=Exaiptasia diaphana TaxID=2652724 RepID=A0A913XYP8_EXADI|nr:uncharacterized protein LOC110249624 isoform X1 [Exaiptasia diaphana]XP_020911860.1 uncharacterized protein LOC110249624 isoform X2 [Exaiptasia diaphana]